MIKETFCVVFDSDVFQVEKTIGEALGFLSGIYPNLREDMLNETRLVMSEALLNAVTHGNGSNASKKVSLEISACDDFSILIRIADEGPGFDYMSVLSEAVAKESIMKEHGRGIRLVYSLADEVSYNKKGNEIRILKKVVVNG